MSTEAVAVQYHQAVELEARERYAEAVEAYRRVLAVDAQRADVYVRLGLLLRHLGRDDEANMAFDAALKAHTSVLMPLPDPARPGAAVAVPSARGAASPSLLPSRDEDLASLRGPDVPARSRRGRARQRDS